MPRSAVHALTAVTALALAGCIPPPAPPAPEPVPVEEAAPPAPPEPLPVAVWNRTAGATLVAEGEAFVIPHVFMRLDVVSAAGADSLAVRCTHCPGAPVGRIAREAVIHRSASPAQAARMDLADFAHAVREASARRDVEALRPVMARDFVHALGPAEGGILEALAAWQREQFREVDRLPFLLDRGIAPVPGTRVWAAPPEFAAHPAYSDLRAGFQRGEDGWEWIFLVRPAIH